MSPTQRAFGRSAVKSRRSRSASFGAGLVLLGQAVPALDPPRDESSRRIESATVFSLTRQPSSRRSRTSRGEPWQAFTFENATVTARSIALGDDPGGYVALGKRGAGLLFLVQPNAKKGKVGHRIQQGLHWLDRDLHQPTPLRRDLNVQPVL